MPHAALSQATSPPVGHAFRSWSTAQNLPQRTITSIAEDRDGCLWVGTRGELSRFDGYRFRGDDEGCELGGTEAWHAEPSIGERSRTARHRTPSGPECGNGPSNRANMSVPGGRRIAYWDDAPAGGMGYSCTSPSAMKRRAGSPALDGPVTMISTRRPGTCDSRSD
jgi:hypothetical protein